MKAALIVAGVVLAALAGLECGKKYLTIRTGLVVQREEAREQWSNVGEALEQRAVLISDLASNKSLGEYATVASQDIAGARGVLASERTPHEKLLANDRLSAVLARLLAHANGNPRMQSDRRFAQWKEELAKCDDQVAVERSRYNWMLEKYNARLQQFPDSLVASISGFHRVDAYFKTGTGAAETPGKPRPDHKNSTAGLDRHH
jgi:LemA protein